MKEHFLVLNSVDGELKDGKLIVAPDAVRNAAKIQTKTADLYSTRAEAERCALDDPNGKDYFAVYRVLVPKNLKGSATEVALTSGEVIQTRTFKRKDVTVTGDVYLSHIDPSIKDFNFNHPHPMNKAAKAIHAHHAAATIAERLKGFVPALSLRNAKHLAGLATIGAGYYFGNGAIAEVVARTGYALPEAVATNGFLPVGAGVVSRLAVEVPQATVKAVSYGIQKCKDAGHGIAHLAKAGKAKWWDGRKAPKVAAPNAGDAKVNQLAATLEQPADAAKDASILEDKAPEAVTFRKSSKGKVSLRELIPQKSVVPAAEKTKLTVH